MALNLKTNLWFDDSLLFNGFLPETTSDILEFSLKEGIYVVKLYISDRGKQVSPYEIIPENREEIRNKNINCNGLTMEISVKSDYTALIISNLAENQISEITQKFVNEVFDLVFRIYSGLIEYLRNVEMLYWLQPISSQTHRHIFFLLNTKIFWLDTKNCWRNLPKSNQIPKYSIVSVK